MLSIKTQKKYLKYIGLYKGEIDNKKNKEYSDAILKLQKKYFPKSEQDGIFGNNTEILLVNAYRVKKHCTHFELKEFRCFCGGKYCTGYHSKISTRLLKNVEKSRAHLGVPMTITSGLRCPRYNTLCGGASYSKHMYGKAADFVSSKTQTFESRKKFINWYIKLVGSRYAYQYRYGKTKYATYTGTNSMCNYPEMGNAVHIDVI